ncbi:MAG TPA: bifunctional diguanylate cyclase/phosphodiesterase [Gammaproteobacteria bacterium]|nr:bifunctional diguanylate cyclase/phosphodiesterase [Gammaproteobacteria bacterium]
MYIHIGLLSFLSLTFAILYLFTYMRFKKYKAAQISEQDKLHHEVNTLQTKIQYQTKDPVTKLPSWHIFEDRVTQGIKECARYKFLMGILYVDIDHFKLINTALGFELGNSLLLEVGERLQGCIRQLDSISRQGKDTFVIMLAQLARQETAAIVIQRILQTLAEPFYIEGHTISITTGIGVSFYPADGLTAGALMHNAEYAMLMAKSHGKQHYEFYQEGLRSDSQRELALYNSISSEAFLDELKLFYQPIMNIEQRSIVCVETLIHWGHPEFSNVTSDELFNLADKQRKLNKITERVLAIACRKFQQWSASGVSAQLLAIPVRLKQLENVQFIVRLSQIIQEHKVPPSSIMLELQECTPTASMDILEKSFNMLKYLGVKIAIDDFGSGVFSLRFLKVFNLNYIKLNAAMIDDVAQSEQTRLIIKAIIGFASALSVNVIASGITSEEQANSLRELGVILQQGQLLSAPLSELEKIDKMTGIQK